MKKNTIIRLLALGCFSLAGISMMFAQEPTKSDTTKVSTTPKAGGTANVMLNASADNGPRSVNIGLPASVGGTVILENGLPVVYDYMGQMPTRVWRQNNGIAKFSVLNVSQTALLASDVGVSVSTWTNRGTDRLKGAVGFTTNSFGLLRGDIGISGPLKNNWFYSVAAFLNFDPGTFRSNIATFMDQTQIYTGVLNKKYNGGQIAIQYKFAESKSISTKQSPYIYRENGKVDELSGFRIGRDAYLEQSGEIHAVDPLTGKPVKWDAMKDGGSTSHVIDLMGDHKLNNGMVFDYTLRYHYANSGMYNPYYTAIGSGVDRNTPSSELKHKDKTYYYVDNPAAPYIGYVQNSMMIFSPKSEKSTVMARLELSKKSDNHHWMVGLHNWYYSVNKANSATYAHQFEVSPNPRALMYDQWTMDLDADKKPIPGTGKWVTISDKNGNANHNAAMQYYDGIENKMALVATDNWAVNDKLLVTIGGRAEWQRVDGNWMPSVEVGKDAAGKPVMERKNQDVEKNWWNMSATANLTYKAFQNLGFLADIYYIQQSGKLSSYAGADDPSIDKCEIPGFSAGVYFNHPMLSLVSKFTTIKRTNFKNNSTFNNPETGAVDKKTISYDVSTMGWTTDLLFTPFKGFNLHMLLTLQNPRYKNYEFVTSWGQVVNNNDNVARSVSKTILEIDPSYTFGGNKFRIWASARYFSKEYANYPNTLIFAGRWETFAGLNYKYDKNVEFSFSAVNLFNQSGAQGSISGTNTTTAEQAVALYDRPLSGTYIRPFTLEFKTKVKF